MASGPTTSWQIDVEKVAARTDFIFLGSKITADSDCSPEIKKHLLLGRKAMTNLDSVLKKPRHHFADKGPAEAEAPILWPPDMKSQLIGKDPEAGKLCP